MGGSILHEAAASLAQQVRASHPRPPARSKMCRCLLVLRKIASCCPLACVAAASGAALTLQSNPGLGEMRGCRLVWEPRCDGSSQARSVDGSGLNSVRGQDPDSVRVTV